MSVIVGLAPESAGKELTVGDSIIVQVLFSEKQSGLPTDWSIVNAPASGWMLANGVAFDPQLVAFPDSNEPLSKISIPSIVVRSGKIQFEGIAIKNKKSNQEISLQGTLNESGKPLQDSKKEEFHWTYPYIEFGACRDWLWFSLIIATLIGLLAFYLWRKKHRLLAALQRDPYKKADAALKDLYRFTKLPSNQENWKKFSYALAGTIRKIVDHRYSQNTSEQTDREFLSLIEEKPDQGRAVAEKVGAILREIEEVRYGQTTLSAQFFTSLLEKSQEILADSIKHTEILKHPEAKKKK